jgi:hypothetical protein
MSETTSSPPTAPAPAQAPDAAPASAPPPASQPGISVSEAARLLNQQRKAAASPGAPSPPAAADPRVKPGEARKPSPNEVAAAAAQKPAEAAPKPGAPKAAATPADGLSALDRALGVPGGAPGEAPAATDAGIEIEGRRYSTAQLAEAVRRAGDYTQKTQALAEQTRQLQAQQQALAAVLPYIQPELAKLQNVVGAELQKPDIGLMQSDPQRYFTELHRYEQIRAEQERLGGLTRIQAEAAARAMAQQVAAGNEQLAREFPFWADAQERAAAQAQIVEWATTKGGFSREELRGLTDPRALKLMMKAAQFDRWVAGARTTAPAPTTQAPVRGTAPPPAPTERVSVASEAFEAKPSIRSGAALLAARRANMNGAGRR